MGETSNERLIVGVGRPGLVLLGTVPRLPAPGGQAAFRSLSVQPGGTVPVALAVLLRWGYTARLVGQVSDDAFGAALRQGLLADSLDLSTLTTVPGRVSPFSFDALDESSQLQRTTIHTQGNLPPLAASEVHESALEGAAALLVDGSEGTAQCEAARLARKRSIPVLFAAGRDPTESHRKLLELTDVLVASERFAAEVAPHAHLEDTLADLCALGPRTAIVTLGPEGSIGRRDTTVLRQPILDTLPIRDRRGAGDHFFAGVTHAFLHGWSLPDTLRFATAAAGLSCGEIGALGVVPRLDDVLALSGPEGRGPQDGRG